MNMNTVGRLACTAFLQLHHSFEGRRILLLLFSNNRNSKMLRKSKWITIDYWIQLWNCRCLNGNVLKLLQCSLLFENRRSKHKTKNTREKKTKHTHTRYYCNGNNLQKHDARPDSYALCTLFTTIRAHLNTWIGNFVYRFNEVKRFNGRDVYTPHSPMPWMKPKNTTRKEERDEEEKRFVRVSQSQ